MSQVLATLLLGGTILWAPGTAQADYSQREMDKIMAPVALYPDSLLGNVLVASTYPEQVIQADRWVADHYDYDAEETMEAVEDKDWDDSVKSLVLTPETLAMMVNDMEWTDEMAVAFTTQEDDLCDSVQRLRRRAKDNGALASNDQIQVLDDDGIISIGSTQPNVIVVPQYTSQVYEKPSIGSTVGSTVLTTAIQWGTVRLLDSIFFGSYWDWDNRDIYVGPGYGSYYWRNNRVNYWYDTPYYHRYHPVPPPPPPPPPPPHREPFKPRHYDRDWWRARVPDRHGPPPKIYSHQDRFRHSRPGRPTFVKHEPRPTVRPDRDRDRHPDFRPDRNKRPDRPNLRPDRNKRPDRPNLRPDRDKRPDRPNLRPDRDKRPDRPNLKPDRNKRPDRPNLKPDRNKRPDRPNLRPDRDKRPDRPNLQRDRQRQQQERRQQQDRQRQQERQRQRQQQDRQRQQQQRQRQQQERQRQQQERQRQQMQQRQRQQQERQRQQMQQRQRQQQERQRQQMQQRQRQQQERQRSARERRGRDRDRD